MSIYQYLANRSMERCFYDADGELLLVPQLGRLRLCTELGALQVEPLEIAVIPRGMKFRVELLDGEARGYIAENHGAPLRLPDLGPIGSNGLANPRDFLTPVARYEDSRQPLQLVQKYLGELWACELDHSPLDVVAWHGNNVPYKYDLRRFNTIGTVSFDHPDPSIFTVLTSPTSVPGLANIDFVIFPPRWMVAENTFRPPWFHRNLMNEFMGLIQAPMTPSRRLRARRRLAAQLHERPRPGRGKLRQGHRRRPQAAQDRPDHGLHVRDQPGPPAEPCRPRDAGPAE